MSKPRKSRKGKGRHKLVLEPSTEEIEPQNEFEMPGVCILTLTEMTQGEVGCLIGENITTDQSWIYIKKEKLQANIDRYAKRSEFYLIRKEIQQCPDQELLMGISLTQKNALQDEFFICLTTEARDIVLQMIEDQRQEMQARLKRAVLRDIQPWECLGSNIEVDDEQLKNTRNLYEVEVESRYPLYEGKISFSERTVEEAVDGYVELLTLRFPPNHVRKLKVDRGVQASPKTIAREQQTNSPYPKNISTQYKYEYVEPQLNITDFNHLNAFFEERIDYVCDSIRVNGHINLHEDDYLCLAKRKQSPPILDHREIFLLQDVIACKGMKVSSISWHPLISGLLAVSYMRTPYRSVVTENPKVSNLIEKIHGKNLVLIWSYSDHLQPKLYLHADREVFTVNFCETNPNILAGGLSNGQIVLWDITGRLEKVEARKMFTRKEQDHALSINSLMKWMKFLNSEAIVLPTVVSEIDVSHTSAVTNIDWLSSQYKVTPNGKVIPASGIPSLQFASCGTDGHVLIWDLNAVPKGEKRETTSEPKTSRLDKRPSALTVNVSPLTHLNKVLCPIYKIIVEHPTSKLKIPCGNVNFDMPQYKYTALNPETIPNIEERTYFKLEHEKPFEFIPKFTINSSIGMFADCSWEGNDFDQGQKVNTEHCKVSEFLSMHDGPVRCYKSPFFPNLLLSLGGRVFAIWDTNNPKIPLLWRKAKVRYIFAIWSRYNPSLVMVARMDSFFELWDTSTTTRYPTRIQRLPGNVFIDGFTELYKVHTRKFTIGVSDHAGALKIYHLHHSFTKKRYKFFELIKKKIEDNVTRKKVLEKWRADWIARYVPQHEVIEEIIQKNEAIEEEPDWPKPIIKLSPAKAYAIRQENFMYQTLLEKKKLNIIEIEQHKVPLQRLMNEAKKREIKRVKYISSKNDIFENQKNVMIKDPDTANRALISVDLPKEQITPLKCSYITAYKEKEPQILAYIRKNSFRFRFDWKSVIVKARRRTIDLYEMKNKFFEESSLKLEYKIPVINLSDVLESNLDIEDNIEDNMEDYIEDSIEENNEY